MTEQRLERLENLLEQLVTMVGNNNAATEEIRQRMDALETKVDRLETKVDRLETKVDALDAKVERLESRVERLESRVEQLETKVERLEAKVDAGFAKMDAKIEQYGQAQQDDVMALLMAIDTKTDNLEDKFDALNLRLFSQETQLQRLKKLAK